MMRQAAEGRGQRAEGRGQRAEGKRWRVAEWARKKLSVCCAKPTHTGPVLSVTAMMPPLPSVCLWRVAHASAHGSLYNTCKTAVVEQVLLHCHKCLDDVGADVSTESPHDGGCGLHSETA
jgi:hypothetical protein